VTVLERFAKEHRLKTTTQDGETTIPGRQGHIYARDDDAGQLAVMFLPAGHHAKTWGNFRRVAVAEGMAVVQNGDAEGCLEFDRKNKAQVKMAIKIARVRAKRARTPEQVAKFLQVTRKHRFSGTGAVETGL
jgi:hypothetical protein